MGNHAFYEPISVIEFDGTLTSTGESWGHYICYIKEKNPAPGLEQMMTDYQFKLALLK